MTNNDSFIDEVTEEVRRDQLFAFFRRYGWIPVLGVILLVGGVAFNEYRKSQAEAEAEALGDAILSALEGSEEAARASAVAEIVPGENAQAQTLVAMIAAAVSDEGGNVDALWALADNADIPPLWRDVAALKAAIAAADDMPADDLVARLEPLALPGAPYRLLAMEQLALAELRRGETSVALGLLAEITADDATGQGLRQRAEQLIVSLGGDLLAN